MDAKELVDCQKAIYDLVNREDYESALPVIYAVLEEYPNDAPTLHFLGYIWLMSGKEAFAYQMFRRALQEAPEKEAVWTSMGRACHELDRKEEAIKYFLQSAKLNPEYTLAYSNASATLVQLADWDGAEKAANLALETDPNDLNARMNLSHCFLAKGKWKKGWAAWGLSLGGKFRKEWTYGDENRWDGTPGKRLVIYGEQGLGDEMSYASCIPDAIQQSEHVYVDCDPKLEGLFRRSFPKATVHGTRREEHPEWLNSATINARCAIGGLPEFFRNSDKDFPGKPYLIPDPDRQFMFKSLFQKWGGKVVGLCTQGGVKMTNIKGRDVPFDAWLPILKTQGYHFVSLDYKPKDTDFLEQIHGVKIHKFPFATQSADYDDTAALISALDLVIGVNTAALHASSGMGVRTIALVPTHHQWRFSYHYYPWSPMRLYMQGNRTWAEALEALKWE